MSEQAGTGTDGSDQGPQFVIQKIYVKDVSFESPHAPDVFQRDWRPDVDLQLHSDVQRPAPDLYEVSLRVTVEVKSGERSAFVVEVEQAGLFLIQGVPEEGLGPMLGSFCPAILFPYAREAVSDLVTRGGFPQLLLAPVNFDALYQHHLEQQGARPVSGDGEGATH